MAYTVPTLEQLQSFLVALWKFQSPKSNVSSKFSWHWKRLRAFAAAVTDLHAAIASAIDAVMPDTSTGSYLARWGSIVRVVRKGATGARGTSALRVTGVVGSTVTSGDQLTDDSTGNTFQVTATKVIPASGFVDTDVAAISTGSSTRLLAGKVLKFVAPAVGITQNATIVIALTTEGYDIEQDPAYSVRVNAEFGEPRLGGHEADFVKWALEVAGVSSAKAYPNRAGIGTMDVVGFHAGQGTSRAMTGPEIAVGLAYLKTKVPAQLSGLYSALRWITTTAVPTPLKVKIVPNGDLAYAFDWDEGTSPPVVSSYTTATKTIKFTATLPGSLLAGMRVVFDNVISAQDGRVFTVDVISTTTNPNDTITLREQPPVDLGAGDIMYAGGPLTQPIRDALLAHMNGEIVYADRAAPLPASVAVAKGIALSRLNVLVDALGPANPLGVYGSWNGDLLLANINRIAGYASGVRNVINVLPSADQLTTDNAFPADDSTNFITPSIVLVRKG